MPLRRRKRGWGGARPGAGRPRKPRVTVLTEYERREVVAALKYGPYGWDRHLRVHVELHSDDELRAAFESWALDAVDWRESHYAYQRFVAGLTRDAALAAALAAGKREDDELVRLAEQENGENEEDE